MTSQDFCYWLQGFFEIQQPQNINQQQTHIIKEHLKLVFQYDKNPYPFCNFLNGYLALENPIEITAEKTKIIETYLNNVFAHVIKTNMAPIQKISEKPTLQALC